MKVVLFCGGLGMRLREYSTELPKPMVPIGDRPVLWHVMKYYAHFGHNEFILTLGHKASTIKEFFLNYDEAVSNDFVLRRGGREKMLLSSDIDDWTITFVDTGLKTEIGERLRRVKEHIGDDEMFLANYADGVTDLDLNAYIDEFKSSGAAAQMLAIRPPQSYHMIHVGDEEKVESIAPIQSADIWLNGGYFAFRREVFDSIHEDEDLVSEPFHRLVDQSQLVAKKFEGFFWPMDTFKDKTYLDDLHASGEAPWMLWER